MCKICVKKNQKTILEKSKNGHFKNVQNGFMAPQLCKIFYTFYKGSTIL